MSRPSADFVADKYCPNCGAQGLNKLTENPSVCICPTCERRMLIVFDPLFHPEGGSIYGRKD